MRAVLGLLAALVALPAAAQDCSRYTSEQRPEGEVVAIVHDDRTLEIVDEHSGSTTYDLVSAGTGIPYMLGVPTKSDDGNTRQITFREHKDDLIVDMVAFTMWCGEE